MSEGSPTRALERGEKVELPPTLYIEGTADMAHPKPDRERFVESYRKAGGHLKAGTIRRRSRGLHRQKRELIKRGAGDGQDSSTSFIGKVS